MTTINNNQLNRLQNTVAHVTSLLSLNNEWENRFKGYADSIQSNSANIKNVRSLFHEWDPLKLYLNTTNAVKAKVGIRFELRFLGQAVAELKYTHSNTVDRLVLSTLKYDNKNSKFFGCAIQLADVDWRSKEARDFRIFFKSLSSSRTKNHGNEEHRIESLTITELLKKTNKALPNVRPITVEGLRYPMPTPLSASKHGNITYAVKGGNIDVFARAGGGPNTHLCVLELKDENKKSEPALHAVEQALAYSIFIQKLLRSKSGQDWWKIFGFSRKLPDSITIYASCFMPSIQNNDLSFAHIALASGQDKIVLHYCYFEEHSNKFTKPILTSL